jgi:nucleotide-binding universal stress UspA family protein
MYKQIMVGIDGSKYAENALDKAIEIAKMESAKLVITHIFDLPETHLRLAGDTKKEGTLPPRDMPIPDEISSQYGTLLKKYAEKARMSGVNDVWSELVPIFGNAGAGLLMYSELQGSDLLIVGSRGRAGFKKAVLGSVADYAVRNGECDVLAVKS